MMFWSLILPQIYSDMDAIDSRAYPALIYVLVAF